MFIQPKVQFSYHLLFSGFANQDSRQQGTPTSKAAGPDFQSVATEDVSTVRPHDADDLVLQSGFAVLDIDDRRPMAVVFLSSRNGVLLSM